MRRLVILLGVLAAFLPSTTLAAVQGSILIEQVSPSELGAWTLTAANGTQWTSADPKVSPKKFSLSIADVGLLTFKVTAPAGASAKIVIYRGGELVKEVMSNQYSFTLYPNDKYRFFVQYVFDRLGSIGITSTPSAAKFRMTGPSGKLYLGTSPMTFTNLPAGRYAVQMEATTGCSSPKPQSAVIQPAIRTTLHLTMFCETVTSKVKAENKRPTKRSIIKKAEAENEKRIND